jgi:very-short-patch-repair endonuclease
VQLQPDFYYDESRACIFVDGAAHNEPSVRAADHANREALANRGYRVIAVGPDIDAAGREREDIFGPRSRR